MYGVRAEHTYTCRLYFFSLSGLHDHIFSLFHEEFGESFDISDDLCFCKNINGLFSAIVIDLWKITNIYSVVRAGGLFTVRGTGDKMIQHEYNQRPVNKAHKLYYDYN